MSNHTMAYIAFKAEQKKKENDRIQSSIQNRNKNFMKNTNTVHTKIPDMRAAYQSVLESDYTPSEEFIHYQRFTSGRVIDGPPNKRRWHPLFI